MLTDCLPSKTEGSCPGNPKSFFLFSHHNTFGTSQNGCPEISSIKQASSAKMQGVAFGKRLSLPEGRLSGILTVRVFPERGTGQFTHAVTSIYTSLCTEPGSGFLLGGACCLREPVAVNYANCNTWPSLLYYRAAKPGWQGILPPPPAPKAVRPQANHHPWPQMPCSLLTQRPR